MITKELLDYIKNESANGKNFDVIKNNLLQNGWNIVDIEEALKSITSSTTNAPNITPNQSASATSDPQQSEIGISSYTEALKQIEISKKNKQKRTKIISTVIGIAILLTAGGGTIYGYYAGYFVSLEKISSEAFTSIQNSKSVFIDTTVNIELPKPENQNISPLAALGISGQNLSMTIKGFFDRFDPENIKLDINASLNLGTADVEAELRMKDKTLYATLLKAPNLAYAAFLSPYINKWYSFALSGPTNPVSEIPLMSMVGIDQSVLDKLTTEQKDYILNLTKNAHFITIVKKLPPENINGVSSYHFTFGLDQVGIKNYLAEAEAYLHETGKNDSMLSAFSTNSMKTELDKPINLTGEAWIGRNDHRPYKIVINLSVDQIMGNTSPINIAIISIFKDWDKPMDVVAPTDAVPFETLINGYMQGAQEKSVDARTKSLLSNARAQAEIFYDSNKNSYKGLCTSKDFKNLLQNLPTQKGFTCKDNSSTYAASALLSDKKYWCVDSTGRSAPQAKPITTTSCTK